MKQKEEHGITRFLVSDKRKIELCKRMQVVEPVTHRTKKPKPVFVKSHSINHAGKLVSTVAKLMSCIVDILRVYVW